MDNVIADLRGYCRALALDHYIAAATGPAAAVDAPIAEATICERCGQYCTLVAYVRYQPQPRSYIAIAGCWGCNCGILI